MYQLISSLLIHFNIKLTGLVFDSLVLGNWKMLQLERMILTSTAQEDLMLRFRLFRLAIRLKYSNDSSPGLLSCFLSLRKSLDRMLAWVLSHIASQSLTCLYRSSAKSRAYFAINTPLRLIYQSLVKHRRPSSCQGGHIPTIQS